MRLRWFFVACGFFCIALAFYFMQQHQTRNYLRLIHKIDGVRNFVKAEHYDPQFVKLEHFAPLDQLDQNLYAQGASAMREHKAVFAGIARDNINDLLIMMRHLEYLGKLFAEYRIVIFENDSSDGTKEILQRWQQRNPHVKILTKDFGNTKRPNIEFLANARNYYLDEISADPQYKTFDILVVIDMDMAYGFDVRGIEHSFNAFGQWDAVCSNGVSNTRGEMYDIFALRTPENPLSPKRNYLRQLPTYVFVPGSDLVPVYSCFGGLAIYKRKFIEDCHYASINNECEHVPFHECLRKNKARFFLNPSQVIRYSHFYKK